MKFTIARDTLLKPLQFIVNVVERRQTLPILSNVLLSLAGDELRLTATDLEIELVMRIKMDQSYQHSEITIPARKLMNICRSFVDNSLLELALDGEKFNLKAERSRFNLMTLPAADFPDMDSELQGVSFTLMADQLLTLFNSTAFSMAQQDVRYFLNGTLLTVADQMLTAVATDGHRLALTKQQLSSKTDKDMAIIIPRKAIIEIQRLLAEKNNEPVVITLSSNHIQLTVNTFYLISKLIEGCYPDYQKVIPSFSDNILSVDRDAFKLALTRVSVLSNEHIRGVRMQVSTDQLCLLANNSENEQAEDEIEVNYRGKPMEISININYLLDVLAVLSAGSVTVYLVDANCGVLITQPEYHSNSLYLVMPMRL